VSSTVRFPSIVVRTDLPSVTDPTLAARELASMLSAHPRWFVLSGAGCSTGSGIPAYRDAAGTWKHSQPMTYQSFMGSQAARQRYWARSVQGFGFMREAQPNAAHRAVRELQARGDVATVVTQNVDGLHEKAGTENVVALHGVLSEVVCMTCRLVTPRAAFQHELLRLNPGTLIRPLTQAPDGDAVLEESFEAFSVPPCSTCGGIVKPNVVFFGEGVPSAVVAETYAALGTSGGLLVLGSSLTVFSGFRFVRTAEKQGLPIVIVNTGATRGDALASLKLDVPCEAVLPRALELLAGG